MTRREEIIEKAQCIEHYGMQEQFAFIAGAQWADKTKKALDWLKDMTFDYIQGDVRDFDFYSFEKDFRKAMEE